jgi:hypothetical protein
MYLYVNFVFLVYAFKCFKTFFFLLHSLLWKELKTFLIMITYTYKIVTFVG